MPIRKGTNKKTPPRASSAIKPSFAIKRPDARVYLGAVSSFPVLAEETSKSLIGQKLTEENIAAAAVLARKPATPLDNTDFVVNWRKQMAQRYVEGALRELAGLPPKVKIPEHGRGVA